MKARTTNNVQSKRSTKTVRKDQKLQKTNSQKKTEQEKHKDLDAKEESSNISTVASDSTTQSDPSEAYETVDVRYLDDDTGAIASADAHQETDSSRVVEKTEKEHNLNGSVCDLEKDVDEQESKDANIDKEIDTDAREGINADVWEDASNGALSAGSENEAADVTENNGGSFEEGSSKEKIEHLETRIEKLEEELREVAALEISLYSVVPDHCSSAHKLHTPARRISRIYIHACKHFTQGKRATIARNSVSGLVLVAKSCGNDVSRYADYVSHVSILILLSCDLTNVFLCFLLVHMC